MGAYYVIGATNKNTIESDPSITSWICNKLGERVSRSISEGEFILSDETLAFLLIIGSEQEINNDIKNIKVNCTDGKDSK